MIQQSAGIVVAKVNAEELYEEQLEKAVQEYDASLKEQGINVRVFGKDQMRNVRKFLLHKMVERELLHQEAVKKKVKVTSKEVNQAMDESEKHYPSRQEFLDDILKDGQTMETYKERLAYDMLINKLISKRYEKRRKEFSKAEISRFYQDNLQRFAQPESVNIGHILLKISPDADEKEWDNAKKRLRELRERKEDFRELAKKYSECDSAKEGGDLGFHARGQLYPPLELAASKLRINEVSRPVVSREGVHLVKLYERRPHGFIPHYDEIKDYVEKVLKTEHAQKIYQDYVDELREKAKIEILEN